MLGRLKIRELVLLLLCHSLVWAVSDSGQLILVDFSVLDENQHPVGQALVELRLQNGVVATTTTDSTGKGNVEVIPGRYLLRVTKKDYISNEDSFEIRASEKPPEKESGSEQFSYVNES